MKKLLYTRTGDDGSTSLAHGLRLPKFHPKVEALGDLDELQSFIGLLKVEVKEQADLVQTIQAVQDSLFAVGAMLAEAREYPLDIPFLEKEIARLVPDPEGPHFLCPGHDRAEALAHVCRTVCRRTERHALAAQGPFVTTVAPYLNRLASLFYAIARSL